MARGKKKEHTLTPEEKLEQALVPDWECPYKVPENWRWTVLKACCKEIFSGKSPKYSKEPTDIRIIGQQANRREGIDLSYVKYGTVDFAESQEDRMWLRKNDVLLNTLGSGTIGRSGIYKDNERLLTDGHLFVFRSNECYLPDLMYYYLCANEEQIIKSANGSTNQKFLSLSTFSLFPLPVPPIAEQQRIVDRIESLFAKLDEAKEKAQTVLDSFETRKAAILHKAFTGELTAKWRAEHGVGLESWKETTVGRVCHDVKVGIVIKPSQYYTDEANGTPAFRSANVRENYIDDFDWVYLNQNGMDNNARSIVHTGDVLVVRSGNPGTACVVTDKFDGYNAIDILIAVPDHDQVTSEFLCCYTNSPFGKNLVSENKRGMALAHFNVKGYSGLPIRIPQLVEQREVIRILDSLFAKEQRAKEAAEAVLEKIDLLKKSILARAFRGELGTNDPSEESAVELLKRVLESDAPAETKKRSKSVPKELREKLETELERKIIHLYFQRETESLPAEVLLSVSSKKFDVLEAIHNLEHRGFIKKLNNGNYRLLG